MILIVTVCHIPVIVGNSSRCRSDQQETIAETESVPRLECSYSLRERRPCLRRKDDRTHWSWAELVQDDRSVFVSIFNARKNAACECTTQQKKQCDNETSADFCVKRREAGLVFDARSFWSSGCAPVHSYIVSRKRLKRSGSCMSIERGRSCLSTTLICSDRAFAHPQGRLRAMIKTCWDVCIHRALAHSTAFKRLKRSETFWNVRIHSAPAHSSALKRCIETFWDVLRRSETFVCTVHLHTLLLSWDAKLRPSSVCVQTRLGLLLAKTILSL